jgi:phosphoribosylformylglycinamidine cyclo-ligase
VTIHSTGGETADVGDIVRTIIVDSTVTARMKRSKVIDNANIQAGDVIVGLAFGQGKKLMAEWEATDLHLHVMMFSGSIWQPNIQRVLMSRRINLFGQVNLTDVENSPIDAGQLVLSPTRTYAPSSRKF